MLRELLTKVAARERLTTDEAAGAMRQIMSGEASPALAGALLTALKMRGECAEEIAGFAAVMREHSVRVAPRCERLVDTCGTGGGTVPTFNISTTAAFVVAGAGVSVAKHGNRAMTSVCGSADVLEALGVRIQLSPEQVRACIEEVGMGFLFAQAHHPAMKHVAPIRRELPFRTVFNCLGPLTNPAGATVQIIGVYEARLGPLLADALRTLGTQGAMVVHGKGPDGCTLDELSTMGPSLVYRLRDGDVSVVELHPEELGLSLAAPSDLAPGASAAENAVLTRQVLQGEKGPRRDIVLLNAAATLVTAGVVESLDSGIARAAESIDQGAALAKLEALIAATNA